jgi:hypothetical protein
MPKLSSHRKRPHQMRDGESLTELSAANDAIGLFRKDAVDVEVEATEVIAHQDQHTIPERADVDLRRRAFVKAADVTQAHRRLIVFSCLFK